MASDIIGGGGWAFRRRAEMKKERERAERCVKGAVGWGYELKGWRMAVDDRIEM